MGYIIKTIFPYTYSSWDGNLDTVATRFRTDAKTIYNLSRLKKVAWQSMTFVDFFVSLHDGETVQVPIPLSERSWQFGTFAPRPGQTLASVCAELNTQKARTGMPNLTPAYLWSHVANFKFRYIHLYRSRLNTAKFDANPSTVTVLQDSPVLWVPYPIPDDAGHISVAPLKPSDFGIKKQTTVATKPDWISDLSFWLDQISDRTERLERSENECAVLRQRCGKSIARLSSILALLDLLEKAQLPGSKVRPLREKLDAFYDIAADVMATNPANVLGLPADRERLAVATSLLEDLRWSGFKKLVDRAIIEGGEYAGKRLLDRVCGVVERAYESLADGYLARDHHQDVEAAMLLHGQAKGGVPPATATTALASLLSLIGTPEESAAATLVDRKQDDGASAKKIIGTLAQIAAPMVGNLPGPSTLGVSVAKALAHRYCVTEFKNPEQSIRKHKALYRFIESALKFSDDEKLLMKEVFEAADALKQQRALNWGGEALEHAVTLQSEQQYLQKIRENTVKINDKVAARVHKSTAWRSGMFALTLFGLYYTITEPDELSLRFYSNLAGATSSATAAGADIGVKLLQILGSDKRATALQKVLSAPKVGLYFGLIGATAAFVSGLVTAIDGFNRHSTKDAVAGTAQAVGGLALGTATILVAIGYAPYAVPVIAAEVVAGLALSVSVIASNWDELKKLPWAGTKKLTKCHLGAFEASLELKEFSEHSPALVNAWNEVKTALDGASFADFDKLQRPAVEKELSRRFGEDIDFMFQDYWRPAPGEVAL